MQDNNHEYAPSAPDKESKEIKTEKKLGKKIWKKPEIENLSIKNTNLGDNHLILSDAPNNYS